MFFGHPKSLSGQLVLILLLGVATSLVLSALVHIYDREHTLSTVGGMFSAQRFSGIVRVMELAKHEQREVIATALNTPFQATRILKLPPVNRHRTQASDKRAMFLHNSLQKNLGSSRALGVMVVDTILPEDYQNQESGMDWHMEMMRKHNASDLGITKGIYRHGISYIVQIQLLDGTWLEFHDHLTEKVLAWPKYILYLLIALFIVVTWLSFVAVRLVTQPLTILANAADELGKDIHQSPLPEVGSMELQKAARALISCKPDSPALSKSGCILLLLYPMT